MLRYLDVDPSRPASVWLHPHRGAGASYAALATVVLVIVVPTVISNLVRGWLLLALAATVGGIAVTGLLAVLALALLLPGLDVRATGLTGRLGARRRVDVGWDEVTVDVSEEAPPGRLRLDVADDAVEVDVHSWAGFRAFVLLVISTPAANRRLTPAARGEITRLLGVEFS
ncbi:MAG TPA: hypothetical protein VEQ66_08055 [Propionibacteriaceae bacterium]|nr:hypothetical protein [Propionibacteriaceae bacterium]